MSNIGKRRIEFLRWLAGHLLERPAPKSDWGTVNYPFKFNPLPNLPGDLVEHRNGFYQLTDEGRKAAGLSVSNVIEFKSQNASSKKSLITKKFSTNFYGKNKRQKKS